LLYRESSLFPLLAEPLAKSGHANRICLT
jgi:hypothetical protein